MFNTIKVIYEAMYRITIDNPFYTLIRILIISVIQADVNCVERKLEKGNEIVSLSSLCGGQ